MAITLIDFARGRDDYPETLTADNQALRDALDPLLDQVSENGVADLELGAAFSALHGTQRRLVNGGSYLPTGDATILTIAPGYLHDPAQGKIFSSEGEIAVDFNGFAAATYYVHADPVSGDATVDQVATDALYSVVWTGAAFGAITALIANVPGGVELSDARDSATRSLTHQTIGARLEQIESTIQGTGGLVGGLVLEGSLVDIPPSNNAFHNPLRPGRTWKDLADEYSRISISIQVEGTPGFFYALPMMQIDSSTLKNGLVIRNYDTGSINVQPVIRNINTGEWQLIAAFWTRYTVRVYGQP